MCSFISCVIFHSEYVPQLSYPFIYPWTSGLLLYASSFKQHEYHCHPCLLICCQVPKVYFRWLSFFGNLYNENYTIWSIFINEWHFIVYLCVCACTYYIYTSEFIYSPVSGHLGFSRVFARFFGVGICLFCCIV